jgi:hypothetical protein
MSFSVALGKLTMVSAAMVGLVSDAMVCVAEGESSRLERGIGPLGDAK